MIKLTDGLKAKYAGDLKGQVYLFIIAANELALANEYKHLKTDTGLKEPLSWINEKLESITKQGTGPYWNDDFAGFETILEKARQAKPFIVSGEYNEIVADFLDNVLLSHIPKTSSAVIREPEKVIPPAPENKEVIELPIGHTGKDLHKAKLKSIEIEEEIAALSQVGSVLDDEDDLLAMASQLDDEDDEEEIQPSDDLVGLANQL